ncbi:MAG TPA: hypothetical protein VKV17_22180 [Bryobacteraceae bacterium]|nr:hypothetical protein [Bryobacteraceae bacterium]
MAGNGRGDGEWRYAVKYGMAAWGKTCALAALNLLWSACGQEAGWLAIPAQQSLNLGMDPGGVSAAVRMSDADADDYIVRDIGTMPGAWRWAFAHPELRFRLRSAGAWRLTAQIAIPEVTFRVTGPVRVTYFVDGRKLGAIRCDHPGQFVIDQAVPAEWLAPGRYLHVTFEADRHWVSPEDGAQLSFQLFQAGFQK